MRSSRRRLRRYRRKLRFVGGPGKRTPRGRRAVSLALFGATLLSMVLAPTTVGQQALLRGFVTEAARSAPLQGASVALSDDAGTTLGAATDADGFFAIPRIRPGAFTLRVTFVGYESHEERIVLSSGEVRIVRLALQVADTQIDEVIVEAEAETGAASVRAGLQTIVPAEVSRVPVPGVSSDLAAYLQTLPGIVAQGDRGGQLFVRGGAIDQNLTYLDGLPVYMPFHILGFYSAFPEDIINNVDLYTGGFGARFGTRISSMVDVQTRNGNKQQLQGSVALAPFLSGAHVDGPLITDRVSILMSGRLSLVDRIMPQLLGQKFPYELGDVFGKVHAVMGRGHDIAVTALHTYDRGDIAGSRKTFEGDPIAEAETDSNEVRWTNTVVGGRYSFLSNSVPVHIEVAGGFSTSSNEVGPRDDRTRSSDIESVDTELKLTYFFDAAELRVGSRMRRSDLRYELDDLFESVASSNESLTEWTTHVEGEFGVRGLVVEPGLQWYAASGSSFLDPRIRASWTYSGGRPIAIHAAWGRYHQSIAGLNDERDIGNVFTAWVRSPAPLPRSYHAVLGLRVPVVQQATVALEVYRKTFTSLSVPVFSAFPRFTTSLQTADGLAQGIDARISINKIRVTEGWSVSGHAAYALSAVEYHTGLFDYRPAHDRRHQGNVVARASYGEFGITVQFQYGSGLPYNSSAGFDKWILLLPETDVTQDPGLDRILYNEPFGERLPRYFRADIWLDRRVVRARTAVTIRAGAVNVFNRENLFYFDLFTFSRIDQLPFIPSVGLKVDVR